MAAIKLTKKSLLLFFIILITISGIMGIGLFEWDTGDFVGVIGGTAIGGAVLGGSFFGGAGVGIGALGGAIAGGLVYTGGWAISNAWNAAFGDPDNGSGSGPGSGSGSGGGSGSGSGTGGSGDGIGDNGGWTGGPIG